MSVQVYITHLFRLNRSLTADGLDPVRENDAVSTAIPPTTSDHFQSPPDVEDDDWEPPDSIIIANTSNSITDLAHDVSDDDGLEYVDDPELQEMQPPSASVSEPAAGIGQHIVSQVDLPAAEDSNEPGKFNLSIDNSIDYRLIYITRFRWPSQAQKISSRRNICA